MSAIDYSRFDAIDVCVSSDDEKELHALEEVMSAIGLLAGDESSGMDTSGVSSPPLTKNQRKKLKKKNAKERAAEPRVHANASGDNGGVDYEKIVKKNEKHFASIGTGSALSTSSEHVDIGSLPTWDLSKKAIYETWQNMSFTVQEKLASKAGLFAKTPEYDLRQSFSMIAVHVDGYDTNDSTINVTRQPIPERSTRCFTLQNHPEQTEAILIIVVGARKCKDGAPLLEVLWNMSTREQMADDTYATDLTSLIQSHVRNVRGEQRGVKQINASVDEMRLVVAQLEHNATRMDAEYASRLTRGKSRILRASFLVPPRSGAHASSAPKERDARKCAACGEPGNKCCSRCTREWYCSVECQKKHWKVHKVVCKAPSSDHVAVDLAWVDPTFPTDHVQATLSFTGASSSRPTMVKAGAAVYEDLKPRRTFVAKLQVPQMAPDYTRPNWLPIMCYNQKRSLFVQITAGRLKGGQRAFDQLVRLVRTDRRHSPSQPAGIKSFANCYLDDDGHTLQVDVSRAADWQQW